MTLSEQIANHVLRAKDDFDKVYQAGQYSIYKGSEQLPIPVSGEIIRIDDMSKVPHKATVGKRSKNLLKISDREIISNAWSYNTTPITPNGNQVYIGMSYSNYQQSGTISEVEIGNITSFKSTTLQYGLGFEVKVLPNTTYTISIGEIVNGGIYVNFYDKDGNWLNFGKDTYTFTTTADTEWIVIVLRSNEVNILSSFTDIQLELGTTATNYTPYIADCNNVRTKNLFDTTNYKILGNPQYEITENSIKGIFTWGDCVEYTISNLIPNTEYCFSYKSNNDTSKLIYVTDALGSYRALYTLTSTLTASADGMVTIWFRNSITTPREYDIYDIQLEEGSTATEYVPYLVPVKVYKYGKNLATAQEVYANSGTANYYSELVEDDRNCIRFIDGGYWEYSGIKFKENTQYTFSFEAKREIRQQEGYGTSALISIKYTDGSRTTFYRTSAVMPFGEWGHCSFTSTAGKTIESIGNISYHWQVWIYIDTDTFQIEEGATATEYEPYHKEEIGETFDNTTDIVTLIPDTSGVILDCQYCRDIDKGIVAVREAEHSLCWDAFQLKGKRNNYGWAFWDWKTEWFYPKYDIVLVDNTALGSSLQIGIGTFRGFNGGGSADFDLSARLEECGVTLDISKCSVFQYFMHSINVKRVPTLDFSSAANTYMAVYYTKIQIIDKLISSETTAFNTTTFQYNSSLTTITEVEGVIAKSLNFQHSPLDVPTMNRIIACLKDYSSTGGTYTLTLKADRETMLTDEEKAVATNKGWTLVWS